MSRVRELPENLSPATAFTNSEIQSLDLLFRRLIQVHASDGRPSLLPRSHRRLSTKRRPPSSKFNFAAMLLVRRRTPDQCRRPPYRATSGIDLDWRELLDLPRAEGRPFNLQWTAKQGLLDPLAPLRLYILPEKYRGQPLMRADNADFAKAPLGNGPFQYAGRQQEGKRTVAVFRANPYF